MEPVISFLMYSPLHSDLGQGHHLDGAHALDPDRDRVRGHQDPDLDRHPQIVGIVIGRDHQGVVMMAQSQLPALCVEMEAPEIKGIIITTDGESRISLFNVSSVVCITRTYVEK